MNPRTTRTRSDCLPDLRMLLSANGYCARVVLAAGLALTMLASCSSTTPPPQPTPAATAVAGQGDFAGLVDVGGGRKVFLECHGSGSPTVILQSGYGNGADIWNEADAHPPAVAPGVAQFTRECAYDRPGSLRDQTDDGSPALAPLAARSDPAPMPRTAADVTAELHALLTAAGVPGPYVLVSHSFGGLFSLLYARTYPNDVSGMVFIDAVTPQMMTTLGAQWPEYQRSAIQQPNALPGQENERYDPTASIEQIDAAAPLRAMPVTVLLGDEPEPVGPQSTEYSVGFQDAVFRALREAGRQFGASVPGADVSTVPGTTHYVHTQRPDVVIAAIRTVVDELR